MQKSPYSFQKFKKIPLFFSVVFLGFSLFAFLFLYQQISNNEQLAAQMQQEWQTESSRRSQIQSLDNLVKSTETQRVSLESHFAQSSDIVPFLDTVEKLATAVGAQSQVVSVNILKDQTIALMLEVKATGSFEAVYKFLTLLENSPYELDFTSVDMRNTSPPSTTTDQKVIVPQWEADFRIKLLSFIE